MPRFNRIVTAAIAPLALAAFVQMPQAEPGFTGLFNGKDFTGWKLANPESFRIEDGAIVANGRAGHAFYDGPFRDHAFKNFELRVDVMTRAGSNGGIYILTGFQERGFPLKGFEVQVNNTYAADPVKTGSLYHVEGHRQAARERRRVVHDGHHREGNDHQREGQRRGRHHVDAAGGLERNVPPGRHAGVS